MNWLAHVLLSEPTPEFRIGNLLPDLLGAAALAEVPQVFARGVACHRMIDRFTDRHPVVRQSVQRVAVPYRRFAPILVDVFYDHFLSINWREYCAVPLPQYLDEFYTTFDGQRGLIPEVFPHLERMRTENWLGSYGDLAGVRLTLERISRRFRRPLQLGGAVVELERNYTELRADFAAFFPELRVGVAAHLINPDTAQAASACP